MVMNIHTITFAICKVDTAIGVTRHYTYRVSTYITEIKTIYHYEQTI